MRAYTQLLVQTCHRRGAHAIGGMSAFIPNRRQPEVTERALAKVREDKEREAGDGFDGTWVAHPDLVPVAREVFDAALGDRVDQRHRLREDVSVTPDQLLNVGIDGGRVTEAGVRGNVSVGVQYLDNWLRGNGAAGINDLMEDVATAEISRSQLWQWRTHGVTLEDGRVVDAALLREIMDEELVALGGPMVGRVGEATALLAGLALSDDFSDFLTLPAYPLLD
jgi:malate synthase